MITINDFTYSNPYCKWLRYEVTGTDVNNGYLSVTGNKFTYKTDLLEPKLYNFKLWVIAQGDGINGRSHRTYFTTDLRL